MPIAYMQLAVVYTHSHRRLPDTAPRGGTPFMDAKQENICSAIDALASSFRNAGLTAETSTRLGELYFLAGKTSDAGTWFEKALALDPGHVDALTDLGVLHFQEGRYLEAERLFLEAIRRDPGNGDSSMNLSRLYACVPELAERSDPDALHCPCCGGNFPLFLPGGVKLRPNARCPRCQSLERHRLIWLYLMRRTPLPGGRLKVLHFAPEPCIGDALRNLPDIDYTSADLYSPLAMVKMDITDIRYPDDTFDVILCNHVLEHIPDDRKAMAEMHRVLKPGGWAILQVPLNRAREATFEDPAVTTPAERERLFGQADHVRWYGRDYPERLRRAGFDVRIDAFAAGLDEAEVKRCRIVREDIYLCSKADAVGAAQPGIPPASLRFMNETPERFLSIGDSLVADLRELAGFSPDSRLLDIGSGYGRLAHAIFRTGTFRGSYVGMEILKAHSEWCALNIGALDDRFRFLHLDVANKRYNPGGKIDPATIVFPFDAGSFDIVCLTSVFTHMFEADILGYLRDIRRMLAPGGVCYATFFLLNESWRAQHEKGKCGYDLRFEWNGHARYMNEKDPLHAIGYDESWLAESARAIGMEIRRIRLGGWAGRKNCPQYQDVVIFRPS